MRLPLAIALLLAGCDGTSGEAVGEQAGRGLERAATAGGLVASTDDPVGLYASDTDRACVVAAGDGDYRISAIVDYGPDHRCRASGSATGAAALQIRLSDACRFVARFDGDRIVFPAVLPPACDRACSGRASLAAFETERLSASTAEASASTDGNDRPLCIS